MTKSTMFCPFKYDHTVDFDQWCCEGDACALWDNRMRACGLFAAIVMSKAIASNLREIHRVMVNEEDDGNSDY